MDVTTFIVLKQEKNFAQINDLAPGTAYLFRVQAFSSDGSAGGSSMEEQFETLLGGTEENHHKKEVSLALFNNWISLMCVYVFFFTCLFQNNQTAQQSSLQQLEEQPCCS